MIVCHPDNASLIARHVSGERIVPNSMLPKRITADLWIPPDNRYWRGDVLDEPWMRPLLEWTGDPRWGRLVTIDCGPAFWRINPRVFDLYHPSRGMPPLIEPYLDISEIDRLKVSMRFDFSVIPTVPHALVKTST